MQCRLLAVSQTVCSQSCYVHVMVQVFARIWEEHYKNKSVVLITEWLPWLQTSWRHSGYVLYILLITNTTGEEAFPDYVSYSAVSNHWTSVAPICNNNHDLGDIVTTEHRWESPAFVKSIIFVKCGCSDSPTDVLWVVSCKVWFGLRLLIQL